MDFTNQDLNCKDFLPTKGKALLYANFVQKRFDTFINKVRQVTFPFHGLVG